MKKALAFILAAIMAACLMAGCQTKTEPVETNAAPAETQKPAEVQPGEAEAPESEPAAPAVTSEELAALLTEESAKIIALYSEELLENLPEEVQQWMADAAADLKDVDAEGLALRYFFYADLLSGDDSSSVDFAPIPHDEILFMQYIDGVWVTLEHVVGEDGVITVPTVANNPIVIFTDSVTSPGASSAQLVPVLVEDSYLLVQIYSLEEAAVLPEEIRSQIADAKDMLQNVIPEGFAVKFLFFMDILGDEESVSVAFEALGYNQIVFMQYVDGEWVERDYTMGDDGILVLAGAVEAPVAVLVK